MSGITSITAGLYPQSPVKEPGKTPPDSGKASTLEKTPQNLASSIMADGGLGFLRSRLEEKIGSMFDAAADKSNQTEDLSAASFYDSAVDNSPRATADRIVGFALSMMGTYRRQNSDLDEKDLRAGFESEIRKGISDGFDHARGVLGDLELLEGQTEDNVSSTWDWVQELLDDHFREEA